MRKSITAILLAVFIMTTACLSAYADPALDPSDAWLGETDSEMLEDITALINDPEFIASLNLPQPVASMLVPAAEYAQTPAAVIYPPQAIVTLLESFAADENAMAYIMNDPWRFYDAYVRNTLVSVAGSEALALMSSVQLTDRVPAINDMLPVYALYMAADGSEACGILVGHSAKGGVMTISAQVIPCSIALDLMAEDSDLSFAFGYSGVSILRAGDEYPDGEPVIGSTVDAAAEIANDVWLNERALEMATRLIANAGDPAYIGMLTTDPEVQEICAQIGSIDLTKATNQHPVYSEDLIVQAAELAGSSASGELIEKYFGHAENQLKTQTEINTYGVMAVVANAVCTVSDAWCADGDFTSVSLTIETGSSHNIVVCFGNHGDVINAVAMVIPAE